MRALNVTATARPSGKARRRYKVTLAAFGSTAPPPLNSPRPACAPRYYRRPTRPVAASTSIASCTRRGPRRAPRERSTVRFHPKVVTASRRRPKWPACITSNTCSEREEKAIRACSSSSISSNAAARPVPRNKLNAVAADEAWRRADERRAARLESTGLGWSAGRPQGQREAVIRASSKCMGRIEAAEETAAAAAAAFTDLQLNIMQQQPQTPSFRPQATPSSSSRHRVRRPSCGHSLKAVASEPPAAPASVSTAPAWTCHPPRVAKAVGATGVAAAAGQRSPRSQSLPGQAIMRPCGQPRPAVCRQSSLAAARLCTKAACGRAAAVLRCVAAISRRGWLPVRMQANRVRV